MNFQNERYVWVKISRSLWFFGYANHYTSKSHELTRHRFKDIEVKAEHPVYGTSKALQILYISKFMRITNVATPNL